MFHLYAGLIKHGSKPYSALKTIWISKSDQLFPQFGRFLFFKPRKFYFNSVNTKFGFVLLTSQHDFSLLSKLLSCLFQWIFKTTYSGEHIFQSIQTNSNSICWHQHNSEGQQMNRIAENGSFLQSQCLPPNSMKPDFQIISFYEYTQWTRMCQRWGKFRNFAYVWYVSNLKN